MKKRIAIPTQKGKLSKGIQQDTTFNIFEIEDEKVVRVEQTVPDIITTNYTSLWLYYKRVTMLYIEEINHDLKNKLKRLGIIVKSRDELTEDKFFNSFVFD